MFWENFWSNLISGLIILIIGGEIGYKIKTQIDKRRKINQNSEAGNNIYNEYNFYIYKKEQEKQINTSATSVSAEDLINEIISKYK